MKGKGKGSCTRDRARAMDRREAPHRARTSLLRFSPVQNPLLFQTPATQANRPFHGVFQLLTWTSQGKFVDTTGKTALILIKLPTCKVIRPRKVAKNVAVKFRDFDRGATLYIFVSFQKHIQTRQIY